MHDDSGIRMERNDGRKCVEAPRRQARGAILEIASEDVRERVVSKVCVCDGQIVARREN